MLTISDKLYTAAISRQLDATAIKQFGIAGLTLMGRAGNAVLETARSRYPSCNAWVIFCGAGNNGGDGYMLARLAHQFGVEVMVVALADPEDLTGDAATAARDWIDSGGKVHRWPVPIPSHVNLVVDALLGTGIDRPVSGEYREAIDTINSLACDCVAVDIPSGLNADTGVVMSAAVRASVTVTFIGKKRGLFTADGPEQTGDLVFDRLEVPSQVHAEVEGAGHLLTRSYLDGRLQPRAKNSHKGSFGHVMIVGGVAGMSGAVRLAGEGALRAGAGLVTAGTDPVHAATLNLGRPEMMVTGLENGDALRSALDRITVLAVGTGLGVGGWGRELLSVCLEDPRPLVVDADGLNLLARTPIQRDNWVLTPHPAEAARLLSCDTAEVQADRVSSALALADRFGASVVLKGCGSVVAAPNGDWGICAHGNPGMSTAGSGDVLTGVVAAMLAQGFASNEAARLATVAHAAAGDRAAEAGERGLLAGDIARELRSVING